MKKARTYGRYSSQPQERGDSERRQTDGARKYAEREGFNIVGEYFDEAVSGKAGLNLEKEFGRLLLEAENGDTILCEQIDRIGRQHPLEVLMIIKERIVERGLSIVFWQRGLSVDSTNIDNPMVLFSLFGETTVGFSDNSRKMARLRETTTKGFNLGEQGKQSGTLVKYLPQCFNWNESNQSIEVYPDKARIIRRIYDEFCSGMGRTNLCQRLNQEKIPTPYTGERRKTSSGPRRWNETTITRILKLESYAGVLNVKGHRITCIPTVVSHSQWERAQMLIQRYATRHGKLANTRTNNLFAGISSCAHCKSAIGVAVSKPGKNKGTAKTFYGYRCNAIRLGICKCKRQINAIKAELAFFSLLHGGSPNNLFSKENMELKERKSFLESEIKRLKSAIDNLYDMVEDGDSTAKDRMFKRKVELRQVQQELSIVNGAMAEQAELPSAFEELKSILNVPNLSIQSQIEAGTAFVQNLKQTLLSNEMRKKLQNILPLIYSKIIFDAETQTIQPFLKDGTQCRIVRMDVLLLTSQTLNPIKLFSSSKTSQ